MAKPLSSHGNVEHTRMEKIKPNQYEESKISPEKGSTEFEKAFIVGWNKLMDNLKNDEERFVVVEFDENEIKK